MGDMPVAVSLLNVSFMAGRSRNFAGGGADVL